MYVSHHSVGKSEKRNFNKMDQKWASRARVVEKTRKLKFLTKKEKVDFVLQKHSKPEPEQTFLSKIKSQKWTFEPRVVEKTNMSNIRRKSADCDEVLRLPRKNTRVGSPHRDFRE